jgi:hypothetical protein
MLGQLREEFSPVSQTNLAQIVNSLPATLNSPNDELDVRIGTNQNEYQSSEEDQCVKLLRERIKIILLRKNPPDFNGGYTDCIHTLSPSTITSGHIRPADGTSGPFDWIPTNSTYRSWSEDKAAAILYIRGQRGSGKGVLSRYLLRSLLHSNIGSKGVVASFSFDARDERQASTSQLLFSLISQLLINKPQLFCYIQSMYHEWAEWATWTTAELWACLRTMLSCREGHGITCVVAGIHECDSSIQRFLLDLTNLQKMELQGLSK